MRTLFSISALMFFTSVLFAQDFAPIEDVDVLKEHELVLKKEYPKTHDAISIENVQKINDTQSRIIYKSDGELMEAVVNSAREELLIVALFQKLDKKEVPKIILDQSRDKKFSKCETLVFFEVREPSSGKFYAIECIKKDGYQRHYFDELGTYKKPLY